MCCRIKISLKPEFFSQTRNIKKMNILFKLTRFDLTLGYINSFLIIFLFFFISFVKNKKIRGFNASAKNIDPGQPARTVQADLGQYFLQIKSFCHWLILCKNY